MSSGRHPIFADGQIEILRLLLKRNPDGTLMDFLQLRTVTGANRSSLRGRVDRLIDQGVVEYTGERRTHPGEGNRTSKILRITDHGVRLLRPQSLPGS